MLLQHAIQDGMCSRGMVRLIDVQRGERSVLDVLDGFQADGLFCGYLMFEEVVHVGLHGGEVSEHLRCRDDARNRDPLMPVDVTIDAGEIDERRGEAADQYDHDQAKRNGKLLADGQATKPTGRHGTA